MEKDYYKKYEPIFGAWTIESEIGRGSFGKVYKIVRKDLSGEYVAALKAITVPFDESERRSVSAELGDSSSTRTYFYSIVEDIVSEFRLMSQLKGNSNIVSYEDHLVVEHEDDIGWDILIRMELLTPLNQYINSKPLGSEEIVKLGIDICRALELCQRHKIIHRDIKPENILVSLSGDFKLGDFGIARTTERTMAGLSKKGTSLYMAPEVYRGEPYGASADIYSLGLVLYRLLNDNLLPFLTKPITPSNKEEAFVKRVSGEALPRPVNADARLSEIVLRACAFKPGDRYESARQMRLALEGYISEGDTNTADGFYRKSYTAPQEHTPVEEKLSSDELTNAQFGGAYGQAAQADESATEGIFGDRAPEEPSVAVEQPEKKRSLKLIIAAAAAVALICAGLFLVPSIFVRPRRAVSKVSGGYYDGYSYTVYSDKTVSIDYMLDKDAVTAVVPDKIEGYPVTAIGSGAFTSCPALSDIVIPKSVERIGARAFDHTAWLKNSEEEFHIVGDNVLIKYNGKDERVTIPNGVKYISDAFAYNKTVKEVVIPTSTWAIGTLAFGGCEQLEKVRIPAGVTEIEGYAFSDTAWYENLSDEFVIVGDNILLDYNGADSSVRIPDGVEYISGAFWGNHTIEQVTLPDSLQVIGAYAFAHSGLSGEIMVPNGVKRIDDSAFYNCSKLTGIELPNSVVTIGKLALANCVSLRKVGLPEDLRVIPDGAVSYCTQLETIHLPGSIIEIGSRAFEGCTSLLEITIPEKVTSIELSVFKNCSSLRTINIPNGVTVIWFWAFSNCTSLQSVTIPESVIRIDATAFEGCSSLAFVNLLNKDTPIEGVFDKHTTILVNGVVISSADTESSADEAEGDISPIFGLSMDEYRTVNIFLSNFSETGFPYNSSGSFSTKDADYGTLIRFGCDHSWFNYFDTRIEQETYTNELNTRLADKYVAQAVNRFFDIEIYGHMDDFDQTENFLHSDDGYYYWTETGAHTSEGFSLVSKYEQRADKTVYVEFSVYNTIYGYADIEKLYELSPEQAIKGGASLTRTGSALLKKYVLDGDRDSFQLIDYKIQSE